MNRGKPYITRLDFYDGKDRENKHTARYWMV